jgi:uncharacterized OB-fold protein
MTYVPKPEWLNLEWHHATLIAGSLCIQRCGECGRWRHPPRRFCPACSSTDADFAVVSGTGTVISYAVSHRSLDPEWQARVPFSTLVVELEEGPRVLAATDLAPAGVSLGLPVVLTIEALSGDFALLHAQLTHT